MFNTRLLSLVLVTSFLFGGPTGCVTTTVIEGMFDDSTSDAGDVAARVGVVAMLLPVTLSADLLIAVTFGWLIYDDDDDDADEDRYYQREPPPGPVDCSQR